MPCTMIRLKDGSEVRVQYRATRGKLMTDKDRAALAEAIDDVYTAAEKELKKQK